MKVLLAIVVITGAVSSTGAVAAPLVGSEPLYGIFQSRTPSRLIARIDAGTLAAEGKRVGIATGFPLAVSPAGTELVLGLDRFAVIGLGDTRVDGAIQARLDADVGHEAVVGAAWLTPARLLVVVRHTYMTRAGQAPEANTLVAIDPTTGALEWSLQLPSTPSAGDFATVGGRLVLFLPSAQETDATVIVASPGGALRSTRITLPGPSVSARNYGDAPWLVTGQGDGSQAYVVAGDGTVYSIDPATGSVTRHVIAPPSGAPDTSPQRSSLSAEVLGKSLVVSSFFPLPDGYPRAGLYLIDPSTWRARIIDLNTPGWLVAGKTLITYALGFKGSGISIYNEQGSLRTHLFAHDSFSNVMATPDFAYGVKSSDSSQTHVVSFDPATGRNLRSSVIDGQPPALIDPATFQFQTYRHS